MRLIVVSTDTDEYNYFCDRVNAFDYEYKEMFLIDLEMMVDQQQRDRKAIRKRIKKEGWTVELIAADREIEHRAIEGLNDYRLPLHYFVSGGTFSKPGVFTIDEWFKLEKEHQRGI